MNCQGLHPGIPADYYTGPSGTYCRPCAAEQRTKKRPRVRSGDPIPDRSWIDQAACADTDRPEAWFAHREDYDLRTGEKTPNDDYAYAKSVCARCPMTDQCLTDALAWESRPGNVRAGIYGGLDADERKQLLKDRRSRAMKLAGVR